MAYHYSKRDKQEEENGGVKVSKRIEKELALSGETLERLVVNCTRSLANEHKTRIWIEKELQRRKPKGAFRGAAQWCHATSDVSQGRVMQSRLEERKTPER